MKNKTIINKQIQRFMVPRPAWRQQLWPWSRSQVKVTTWCQLKGLVTRIMLVKYQCSIFNTSEDMRPKKNMCVYCHMLKNIRVGRSEIIFFLILFFITELMLDGITDNFSIASCAIYKKCTTSRIITHSYTDKAARKS